MPLHAFGDLFQPETRLLPRYTGVASTTCVIHDDAATHGNTSERPSRRNDRGRIHPDSSLDSRVTFPWCR